MTSTATRAQNARVVIVAESADRRSHLRSLLGTDSGFEVSSSRIEGGPGAQAIVVLDLNADHASVESILPVSRAGVVVLSDTQDLTWIAQSFPFEPIALLRRDCERKHLIAALRGVAAGLTVLEPEMIESMLRPQRESVALEPGEEELTSRETEVLQMMTAGLTNREIGAALGISDNTVKFHVASIFGKMGTSTRTETVTESIRRGLIVL